MNNETKTEERLGRGGGMADTKVSKTFGDYTPWGFDSPSRHSLSIMESESKRLYREDILRGWRRRAVEQAPSFPTDEETLIRLRDQQISKMISLGFHHALDMSEESYRERLKTVPIPVKPEDFTPDAMILIDPGVSPKKQADALGIDRPDQLLRSVQAVTLPTENQPAKMPYAIWVNTGIYYNPAEKTNTTPQRKRLKGRQLQLKPDRLDISTEGVKSAFERQGLRGVTLEELLSLVREQPKDYAVAKDVYALGTTLNENHYPTIVQVGLGSPLLTQLQGKGSLIEHPAQAPSTPK